MVGGWRGVMCFQLQTQGLVVFEVAASLIFHFGQVILLVPQAKIYSRLGQSAASKFLWNYKIQHAVPEQA